MKAVWLIFVNCAFVLCVEHVPVLMWGTIDGLERQVPELSSLSKLSSDDFSDIIMKRVGHKSEAKPVIAVFVEENLSVEDFSWQDVDGHAPFTNLENLTNAASQVDFYPSVHSPLKGLKRLGYRWRNLLADHENEIDLSDDDGTVLVVKLGDAKFEEDRPGLLKRHVKSICNIYEELTSKSNDVVAVYTARHSSRVEPDYEPLVRRVRSVAASDDISVIWNTTNILFYSAEPVVYVFNISDMEKNVTLTRPYCSKDSRGASTESLKCRYNNNSISLELRFNVTEFNYWYLYLFYNDHGTGSVGQLLPPSPIYAPMNFSYHCSPEVIFKNNVSALVVKRFQIQPFMSNSEVFGDSYDCVAFFSVPIWAGLMITALLGFILVIGLAMIMDIHTMDRFDDPKGKTITINAAE